MARVRITLTLNPSGGNPRRRCVGRLRGSLPEGGAALRLPSAAGALYQRIRVSGEP